MKKRDLFILISVVLAVISIAAGVAYVIYKHMGKNDDCDYIECECEPDCI